MKIALISEDKTLLQQMQVILSNKDNELILMSGATAELRGIAKEVAPNLMVIDGRNKEAIDLEHVERLTMQFPAVAVILVSEAVSPKFL